MQYVTTYQLMAYFIIYKHLKKVFNIIYFAAPMFEKDMVQLLEYMVFSDLLTD